MPLLDQHGNLLSAGAPETAQIRAGFEQYLAWVQSESPAAPPTSEQTLSKALNSRQLRRFDRAGGFQEMTSFFPHPVSHGRLSYALLRHIYETSASVRPAVDGLTRKISGLPWTCLYNDFKFHDDGRAQKMVEFLQEVNTEQRTINEEIARFLNDYLVVGRGVIEKVRNYSGDILELIARDGSRFSPKLTPDRMHTIGYSYYGGTNSPNTLLTLPQGFGLEQTDVVDFPLDDLIYKSYAPTTYTYISLPIIETIINEVSLIFLATKAIAWAFMNDEIPAGVLHIGTIGEAALERAKQSFQATRGIAQNRTNLKIFDNVDKVEWVPFQEPFREMQLAELLPIIERIIARNFGLAPIEVGLSEAGARSAEVSVNAAQSTMITPLTEMVALMMNVEVVQEMDKDLRFHFLRRPQDNTLDQSKSLRELQRSGNITRNEVRLAAGYPLVKGGDLFTVQLGNEVVPLDPETGEPVYRNPVAGAPSDQQPGKWQPGMPPPVPKAPQAPKPPKAPGAPQPAAAKKVLTDDWEGGVVEDDTQTLLTQAVGALALIAGRLADIKPPIVHISVPPQEPPVVRVDMQAPQLTVPTPIVNVAAPVVNVTVPGTKGGTKRIERDAHGMISKVVAVEDEDGSK